MYELVLLVIFAMLGAAIATGTHAAVLFYNRVRGYWFDVTHGVDTGGRLHLCDLDILSANRDRGHYYLATPVRTLRSIFAALRKETENFTLVDFGSGKGRVLLVAAEYGFKRVIGVDFARDLTAVALHNIRHYAHPDRKCPDISAVCEDAAEFEIPDDNCVFYFFNPFDRELMSRICANIERSYRRRPRKMIVVLYHPRNIDLFNELSFLKPRRLAGGNTDFYKVFESEADAVSDMPQPIHRRPVHRPAGYAAVRHGVEIAAQAPARVDRIAARLQPVRDRDIGTTLYHS